MVTRMRRIMSTLVVVARKLHKCFYHKSSWSYCKNYELRLMVWTNDMNINNLRRLRFSKFVFSWSRYALLISLLLLLQFSYLLMSFHLNKYKVFFVLSCWLLFVQGIIILLEVRGTVNVRLIRYKFCVLTVRIQNQYSMDTKSVQYQKNPK